MTIILFVSVFVSGYNPRAGTLAYATEMSHHGLLASTNTQRLSYGKTTLAINDQLNQAAQTKANDMVARNYWSHDTPDGQEPWVFINGAGYSYTKAGENLAYGFSSSDTTVNGWMNSPTHKDNLLDSDFVEVGFGFANGSNFNNAGEETVVVAMYGEPYVLASTGQSPPPPAETTSTSAPSEIPAESTSEKEGSPVAQSTANPDNNNQMSSGQIKQPEVVVASAISVSRIETLFTNTPPWVVSSITFVIGFLLAVLLARHGLRFRKLLRDSQNFITHHPVIDSTVLALIVLGVTLVRNVGNIL